MKDIFGYKTANRALRALFALAISQRLGMVRLRPGARGLRSVLSLGAANALGVWGVSWSGWSFEAPRSRRSLELSHPSLLEAGRVCLPWEHSV